MKFTSASYLVMFFIIFLFESSNGSNLIPQTCNDASKNDPNLRYDFCVASLEEASLKWQAPVTKLEDLVLMSIKLTKSNGTSMVSIIATLLKNKTFDKYTKACLRDCFDLYSDSISALDDAMVAFKSKDLDTASINLSAALDDPVTCEDQFKDKKGANSPLTKENGMYFQLNVMSLSFLQMFHQHH